MLHLNIYDWYTVTTPDQAMTDLSEFCYQHQLEIRELYDEADRFFLMFYYRGHKCSLRQHPTQIYYQLLLKLGYTEVHTFQDMLQHLHRFDGVSRAESR